MLLISDIHGMFIITVVKLGLVCLFDVFCVWTLSFVLLSQYVPEKHLCQSAAPLWFSRNPVERQVLTQCVCVCQDEEKRDEATSMLKESARCGSVQSSYLLWEMNRGTSVRAALALVITLLLYLCRLCADRWFIFCPQTADPGRYLQCMRTLRDYAAKGCWEAQVTGEMTCIEN